MRAALRRLQRLERHEKDELWFRLPDGRVVNVSTGESKKRGELSDSDTNVRRIFVDILEVELRL